jgi:putative folate metabolism gamma-glutamate ligase
MIVKAIKTDKIFPSMQTIFEVLDKNLPQVEEGSVVAITSKIVALCEGRVVPMNESTKEKLIEEESDYYLPASASKYGYRFTVKQNTLISLAGIDESNSGDNYVLWPKDSQDTANHIRKYLKKKTNLKNIGVIITDSTCMPMRWGTVGLALGYSGFKALNDYIGKPDLFNRPFQVSRAGIANGLAGTAVLAMGEGTEQTPIVVMEDLPFVEFQDHDPSKEELELFYMKNKNDDLFAPFFNAVSWQKGKNTSE